MVGKKKLYYSISEVSERLDVKPHVLRYWESQFRMLRPKKNRAGNRSYRDKDLEILEQIKELLYGRRFTIEGARKELQDRRKNGWVSEAGESAAPGDSGGAAAEPTSAATASTEESGTSDPSGTSGAASHTKEPSAQPSPTGSGTGTGGEVEHPPAATGPAASLKAREAETPKPAPVVDLKPIRELRSEIVELKEWLESRRGESA